MFKPKNQIHDMDAWVEERLSDYLDNTLSAQERAMVEAHLQTSERARASLESLRWTVSLLKQTPAPSLPRQFTLPVTQRAPARSAPGWMVWGLRGVAVAATAAFVILLAGTLLRQPSGGNTAMVQNSAPAAAPSVMVAMAPTTAPTELPPTQSNAADTNNAPTPIMLTVESPGAAADTIPQTLPATPAAKALSQPTTATNQSQSAIPPAPAQNANPPQPTEAVVALELQPTALAVGASSAAGAAPEFSTPQVEATPDPATQSTFGIQGVDGIITAERLKVRAGPGTQYRTIAELKRDDHVLIVGQSKTPGWLAIQFERDATVIEGWIAARFIQPSGPVDNQPIIEPPENETPESATPTPELSETPTPTSSAPETPLAPTSTPEGNAGWQPIA